MESSDGDIDETPAKTAAEESSNNHEDKQINEVPQQHPESRPK